VTHALKSPICRRWRQADGEDAGAFAGGSLSALLAPQARRYFGTFGAGAVPATRATPDSVPSA